MRFEVFRWTWVIAFCATTHAWGAEPVKRYAVIVANNKSLDEGVAPLAYAVEDGAKFFELFKAAGIQTTLLAAFDDDLGRRHPDAASIATPAWRANLLASVERAFTKIRADSEAGTETHFYFVYTGHGGLGPNREGYVTLGDARFRRSELYREILARSPATYNHVILDACYAYFFVLKRGDSDKEGDYRPVVRDFLRDEELEKYSNTGVVFASSTNSETHEWSVWEAGIFSHELRSGLLGAADVDGDGKISYAEAAAFVKSANAAIDVPKAKPRVFYRAPSLNQDLPLLDLAQLRSSGATLEIDPEHVDRYYLEDSLGVRIADFHPTSEQPVRVTLLGKAPFWLRTSGHEAILPSASRIITSQLAFKPLGGEPATRGYLAESFRKNLFLTPFGLTFYRESIRQSDPPPGNVITLTPDNRDARTKIRPKLAWGAGCMVAAVLVGAGSGAMYGLAARAHDQYEAATTRDEAQRLHATTNDRLYVSRALAGVAGAAAVAGGVLLILHATEKASAVAFAPAPSGAMAGVVGRW